MNEKTKLIIAAATGGFMVGLSAGLGFNTLDKRKKEGHIKLIQQIVNWYGKARFGENIMAPDDICDNLDEKFQYIWLAMDAT